jgi:hypothetical protein
MGGWQFDASLGRKVSKIPSQRWFMPVKYLPRAKNMRL